MELYENFSRALMRRKYERIEGSGGFFVKRKRVRIAQLQEAPVLRGPTQRLRLRRFRLRFMLPGRLVSSLKETYLNLLAGKAKNVPKAPAQAPGLLTLPRRRMLRSSSNDVVDAEWFNQALRRSIAEGRLTI